MKITFIPLSTTEKELVQAALLSCVSDLSPECEAIFQKSAEITGNVTLPRNSNLIYPDQESAASMPGLRTNFDSLSGVDLKDRKLRKGAVTPIEEWRKEAGGKSHEATLRIVQEVQNRGHRALVIADELQDLGVIELAELLEG